MSEAVRSPWDHRPGRLVQMPSAGRIESMLGMRLGVEVCRRIQCGKGQGGPRGDGVLVHSWPKASALLESFLGRFGGEVRVARS